MSNFAKKMLQEFTEDEKKEIKSWAESAVVIRGDTTLTQTEKVKKLYEISWKNSVVTKFLKATIKTIKKNGWSERSLPAKLAISGAILGLTTVGGKFVGIASAGIGASMPFFVLTSAGGALLGVVIDEVNKGNKNGKEK